MKTGDVEARKNIIEKNIAIVMSVVFKNFSNTNYEKKELVSIGLVGLLKAVDNYDVTKPNTNFYSYATICIKNEILMFIRREKKRNNDISIENVMYTNDEGDEIKIADTLKDDDGNLLDSYINLETNNLIREIVSKLNEREREIITFYFGFDNKPRLNQQEIASRLGVTQSHISRLISKTLQKIKTELINQSVVDDINLKK